MAQDRPTIDQILGQRRSVSPQVDPVKSLLDDELSQLAQEARVEQVQTVIARQRAERQKLFPGAPVGSLGSSEGVGHQAALILNTLLGAGVPPDVAAAAVMGRSVPPGGSLISPDINRENSSVMNELIRSMRDDARQAKEQFNTVMMNRFEELKGSQQSPAQYLQELQNMQTALKQIAGDNEAKAAALQPMARSIEGEIQLKRLDIELEERRAERAEAHEDRQNGFQLEVMKLQRMITESDRKWELEFQERKAHREQTSELFGHAARALDNLTKALAARVPMGSSGDTIEPGLGAPQTHDLEAPQTPGLSTLVVRSQDCPTCGAEMQFLEGAAMALCPNGDCPQREHTLNW